MAALADKANLDVYFFYSETCPHCARQETLMAVIDMHNPDVEVHFLEVSRHPQAWQKFRSQYNIASTAVPRTFVGETTFVGYSESEGPLEYSPTYSGFIGYRNQIIGAIAQTAGHEIQLTASESSTAQFPWFALGIPLFYLASFPWVKRQLHQLQTRRYWLGGLAAVCILSLFLIVSLTPEAMIRDFAQGLPFPLFVSTIALADGFNPCAFTVLVILLSLLTYTERRRDMMLVGGTFITTSAVMYFLFILAMIAVGSVLLEQYGVIVLWVLGIGIAIAGLINLKDYFWFKQGVSLSLSEAQQRTISQKAGKIVRNLRSPTAHRLRFLTALGGTVVLAVFVNIVELGCTAILPVVYMTTLVNYCTVSAIGGVLPCYVIWTALYAVIYVIPLFLILANFIYTFESSRISEAQGRLLKLVAGLFMLFFGLVMIFQPQLLLFV
ncbi:MAG: glutaredoxin family protein [Leptolyngbya sp. SIO1E4]|nr:glutaredoxin family protein [Leptolyngbya sp. SIO1E4]